jgi:hypothetical protein
VQQVPDVQQAKCGQLSCCDRGCPLPRLVCLMATGSAPAVLLRLPRRLPACLPLPPAAAGPKPPPIMWLARCMLASMLLLRGLQPGAAHALHWHASRRPAGDRYSDCPPTSARPELHRGLRGRALPCMMRALYASSLPACAPAWPVARAAAVGEPPLDASASTATFQPVRTNLAGFASTGRSAFFTRMNVQSHTANAANCSGLEWVTVSVRSGTPCARAG